MRERSCGCLTSLSSPPLSLPLASVCSEHSLVLLDTLLRAWVLAQASLSLCPGCGCTDPHCPVWRAAAPEGTQPLKSLLNGVVEKRCFQTLWKFLELNQAARDLCSTPS